MRSIYMTNPWHLCDVHTASSIALLEMPTLALKHGSQSSLKSCIRRLAHVYFVFQSLFMRDLFLQCCIIFCHKVPFVWKRITVVIGVMPGFSNPSTLMKLDVFLDKHVMTQNNTINILSSLLVRTA